MTKLKFLNSYVTERLMVAVSDILEAVGGTVLELEEENELLKRRLQEIHNGAERTADHILGSSSTTAGVSASVPALSGHQQCPARHNQESEHAGLTLRGATLISPSQDHPTAPPWVMAERRGQRSASPGTTAESATMNPLSVTECNRDPTGQDHGTWPEPISVKKDTNQRDPNSCISQDGTPVGIPAVSSRLKTDSDCTPQDPCLANGVAPAEVAAMSPRVKSDKEQDSCDQQHMVVDLVCDLEGIKTEPEELSTGAGKDSTEIECNPDPRIDAPFPICALPEATAAFEYAADIGRYDSSQFLSNSGPLSANGVAQEGFLQHIGIDGIGSNLQLDFTPSSIAPLPSGVQTLSSSTKGQRLHLCPQCGKSFSHESRLKIHIRIHTGEKPFACTLCGKRFNNDGTLRNHWRVHTELRLYSCPVCGKSFKDTYTCRKHQRVHSRTRGHLYRSHESIR